MSQTLAIPGRAVGMDEGETMVDDPFMPTQSETVEVSEMGRIVIPAAFRQALNLHVGDDVIVELEGGSLRLRTRRERIRRAQRNLYEQVKRGPSLVDELIAERRAEAARE